VDGLTDKVIVFAGAGGIACATAALLGAGGAKVVVSDVVEGSAENAARAARDSGGDGVAVVADISDEEQVRNLIDVAIKTYGRIDGLFNVAANISPDEVARDTNVVDIELDAWRRTIDVNLTGYLLTLRYALPQMITGGGGSVVNTISDGVYGGMEDKVAYQATKAAVSAMTRHVARKYGKAGVRANSLSPGLVLTDAARLNLEDEFRQGILAMTPARRLGTPADVAATAAFLFSDLSEWITGQVLCVDGGMTMRA
jgi:NAD(P)-dependent dehydrogenase (short-subunit alcohol dehydrogenase family)